MCLQVATDASTDRRQLERDCERVRSGKLRHKAMYKCTIQNTRYAAVVLGHNGVAQWKIAPLWMKGHGFETSRGHFPVFFFRHLRDFPQTFLSFSCVIGVYTVELKSGRGGRSRDVVDDVVEKPAETAHAKIEPLPA